LPCPGAPPALHSFPTRRSSDLQQGVIDYVLKPAERERLGVTVDRLRKRLAAPSPSSDTLQQALARLAEKLEPASRLKWIQASVRSEEHTSELQSRSDLVCRLLL